MLTLPIAIVGYAYFTLRSGVDRFQALANEYSWNCRNIEEVSVAMGHWLASNLPEGVRIGVTDAGAIVPASDCVAPIGYPVEGPRVCAVFDRQYTLLIAALAR